MSDALANVPGLVVFVDGFPQPDHADESYEQALKDCRRFRHNVFSFFVDGREVLVCSRCKGRFVEEPA